jgi:hypothetical protein
MDMCSQMSRDPLKLEKLIEAQQVAAHCQQQTRVPTRLSRHGAWSKLWKLILPLLHHLRSLVPSPPIVAVELNTHISFTHFVRRQVFCIGVG